MTAAVPFDRRDRLAVCVHEAGHAVLAAALGLSVASATASAGAGTVALQTEPRGASASPAGRSRESDVLAGLALVALAQAGALAVQGRLDRRPAARWRAAAALDGLCTLSPADVEIERGGAAMLLRHGVRLVVGLTAAASLAREILDRHATTVAAVARALYRQGRLDARALARLTAPVATDAAMLEFAAEARALVDDFPAAPPPADATGQPCGQEEQR